MKSKLHYSGKIIVYNEVSLVNEIEQKKLN